VPTYKYRCYQCKHEMDVVLPISSDPNRALECEHCSIESMERKIINIGGFKIKKRTLNDWYKNETGRDLLPGAK